MGTALGPWLARWWAGLRPSLRDLHLYGGGLLVVWGIGLWDRAIAFVVAGVYLIYLGRPWR